MSDEGRLDRIEAKIDKLGDAFSSLVRTEEQVVTLFKRQDTSEHRLERISDRLSLLEQTSMKRATTLQWIDRAVLAAIAGGVAWLYQRFGGPK